MLYLALVCIALVCLLAYRERANGRERKELYQRIQAPQTAVLEHIRESSPPRRKPRPIAADDDKRFAERNSSGD